MTYEEYNHFCGALQATTYIRQWGNAHVWKVGGKVFAIGGWGKAGLEKAGRAKTGRGNGNEDKTENPAFTFKVSELNFEVLKDQPGFRPAPYMASRGMKWIQLYDNNNGSQNNSDEALKYYLTESHRLVSLGLSKKRQQELGLNQSLEA